MASRQSDSRGGRDAEIFAEEPIRGEEQKRQPSRSSKTRRHVLDPAMKHRLTGNNAEAGRAWEQATKLQRWLPDGQVCGFNVVILPSAARPVLGYVHDVLLFAIFLLPYEAAFVKSYTDLSGARCPPRSLRSVNRILDAFFIMDFFLQFVLGYVDEQSGKVVTSLTQIRNRYLRSYFVIDVVSLYPFDQVVQSRARRC